MTDHHKSNLSVTDLQGYVIPPPPPERPSLDSFSFAFNKHCRICYEGESLNKLISPCKCSGNHEFVHEECLKAWIVARAEDVSSGYCELCKTEYIMEICIVTLCNTKGSFCYTKKAAKFWGFVVFVCGLVSSIGAISGVMDQDDNMEAYLIALLAACCVSTVIVVFLMVQSAKDAFCIQQMTEWTFKPYTGKKNEVVPKRSELTIFEESDNSVNYAKNYDQSCLILIPDTITVKGKSLATPTLKPSLQDISSQTQGRKAFATRSLVNSLAPSMNASPRSVVSFSRL
mmetsp:Transcript_23124/g.41269  ORF Transcript_23124/g.41269 Transcript_23124/m.41269 type:complete len:286 (+) Transcript_23124:43-900(+)